LEFVVFAKTKNGKAWIPSLLAVRMSNVAISDEMALTLYRVGIIRPVIIIRTV